MAVAIDENSTCSAYFHPGRLVATDWLAERLAGNHHGSWTECGNAVRVPIEVGAR